MHWRLGFAPASEPELRVCMRDASFTPLIAELSKVPALGELPEAYERIATGCASVWPAPEPLYPMLRNVLEQLLRELPAAGAAALDLANRFQAVAALAQRYFDDMDFGFLFDENRQLLRIGYNVDAEKGDQSYYDLLASEARTAVFLAIAKGDIPRETWLRLGRKLTAYRDHVTLLAWSGTMFEYLMPQLHLRSYAGTLLDRSLRAAVRIQEAYGQERGVPWGISEAAHAERDQRGQYQYYAFGVPPLAPAAKRPHGLVIAPYASMLALMIDPARATANLRADGRPTAGGPDTDSLNPWITRGQARAPLPKWCIVSWRIIRGWRCWRSTMRCWGIGCRNGFITIRWFNPLNSCWKSGCRCWWTLRLCPRPLK